MENMYQLIVKKGPKPGQTFPLYSITLSIGRDPISDITINDPEVSRQHARLTQTDDSYEIEDLESTNGTFVNGVQIGVTPVQLAHGNEIRLGSGVVLAFELMVDDFDGTIVEDGLATAVQSSPSAIVTDSLQPPTLLNQESVFQDAESDPLADMENIQEELDQAFSQADWSESDLAAPPAASRPVPVPSSAAPFTPSAPAKDNNPIRRLIALGAILIFLMMCCCCGLLFIMYQWGGDWLLQQMGMVP